MILTSTSPRAWESALILKVKFPNARFPEADDALWSELGRPPNFPKVLDLVRSKYEGSLPSVIIMVTHKEYGEGFLPFFSENELGYKLNSDEIGPGQAVILDLTTKSVTYLR